jgi:hypothetical protein
MWKEVAVAKFKLLSRHFPVGTEEKLQQTSVRIADILGEIWTRDLHNTEEC